MGLTTSLQALCYFSNRCVEVRILPLQLFINMIKLLDLLNEVGEGTATKYQWNFKGKHDTGDIVHLDYEFVTDTNTNYFVKLTVSLYDEGQYEMMIAFGTGKSAIKKALGDKKPFATVVNKGELYRVMATVMDIVKDGIAKCNQDGLPIKYLIFKPEQEKETKSGFIQSDQRLKLYKAYIEKNKDLVQSIQTSPQGAIEVTLK